MTRTLPSPERVSVSLGLCIVMLSALPRYMVNGHETRQTLLIIAILLVGLAAGWQWRLLDGPARQRLSRLLLRLGGMLILGSALMGAWHALFTAWISWQVFISHAATCGLLLHAVTLWWSAKNL